jgi:putative PIN family toxin of toxin-antitoxin system
MAASGDRAPLFGAWRQRRFALVVSVELLSEFESVTTRSRVRRFLPPLRAQRFAMLLRTLALFVVPAPEYPRCRDPKDDVIVATAVAARPCYLITADRDLYDDNDLVGALRDLEVSVVQSRQFLVALSQGLKDS